MENKESGILQMAMPVQWRQDAVCRTFARLSMQVLQMKGGRAASHRVHDCSSRWGHCTGPCC